METDLNNNEAKPPEAAVPSGSSDRPASQQGIFLPVSILMIAVMLFLGWELYLTKAQGAGLQKTVSQREPTVNRARGVAIELRKIQMDLLSISETNPDARTLVQKYQITTLQKR